MHLKRWLTALVLIPLILLILLKGGRLGFVVTLFLNIVGLNVVRKYREQYE